MFSSISGLQWAAVGGQFEQAASPSQVYPERKRKNKQEPNVEQSPSAEISSALGRARNGRPVCRFKSIMHRSAGPVTCQPIRETESRPRTGTNHRRSCGGMVRRCKNTGRKAEGRGAENTTPRDVAADARSDLSAGVTNQREAHHACSR